MIKRETIQALLDALEAGNTPSIDPQLVPCFSKTALKDSPIICQDHLRQVLENLSEADIPTLRRALVALSMNEQAWLGFKIVYDADACLRPDEQSPEMGPSEDAVSTLFFANEGKDILCSRPWNKRDRKQMLDVTRGPSMHVDQFKGVTWCSVPLFATNRVVIYGAGEVSTFLERHCHDCGFDTVVVDDDEAFLTPSRFPQSQRILVKKDWSDLSQKLPLSEEDYCCVLTRGHVHDVDALVHAVKSPATYKGMMGNPGKNADVMARAEALGCTAAHWEGIHAPIGVPIADKTPAEIAIAIAAELIDVRGKERKQTAKQVAQMLQAQKG